MTENLDKANTLFARGEIDQGLRVLEQAAVSGDVQAQFQLGLSYYRGKNVRADLETAWKWFKEADLNGHLKAPYYIGRICTYYAEQAIVDPQTSETESPHEIANQWHDTAMRWYLRSAQKGYHPAMTRVGVNYLQGIGCSRDWDKAYDYLMQAKLAGNYIARSKIARMLILGHQGFGGIFRGFYELLSGLYLFLTVASRKTYNSEDEIKEITLM